ncbi:MAG: hypothetical protein M1832_002602 [Thelocarpon impressellum]|nr:MAG: hypothetical protein M1832_002602 [Thelocarpon impressellum]
MLFSNALVAALAVGLTTASPIAAVKRNHYTITDFDILNYALTLEYLERKFYQEGLANYTQEDFIAAGFADPFYHNLKGIYKDEQTHVTFLNDGIIAAGGSPVAEATYAFPVTDAKSFVTLSSVLEGVGVSAYLGAAADILSDDYLTAAGSILTIEARHSSYIRGLLGESPFPASFDTPLDFNEVFTLASPFITGFAPGAAPLPFKAFPALTPAAPPHPYEEGHSTVTFTDAAKYAANGATLYAVFISGLQKLFVPVYVTGADLKLAEGTTIPSGVTGQVYVVLSTSATTAKDADIVAGPAILEVLPKGGAKY